VATQAHAIAVLGRTIAKADYFFLRVRACRNVQTSRTVALFAGDVLHGMRAPSVELGWFLVALATLVLSDFVSARNFNELAEVLMALLRRSLMLVLSRK